MSKGLIGTLRRICPLTPRPSLWLGGGVTSRNGGQKMKGVLASHCGREGCLNQSARAKASATTGISFRRLVPCFFAKLQRPFCVRGVMSSGPPRSHLAYLLHIYFRFVLFTAYFPVSFRPASFFSTNIFDHHGMAFSPLSSWLAPLLENGPGTGFMLTLHFPLYRFFTHARHRADHAPRATLFDLARYLTMKKPLERGLCSRQLVVQILNNCTCFYQSLS